MTWVILFSGPVLAFLLLVPLGRKWELETKVTLPAACAIGTVSGGLVSVVSALRTLSLFYSELLVILAVTGVTLSLLLWRFFRDPERMSPDKPNAIVSPADGKVMYVKAITDGTILFSEKNGQRIPLNQLIPSELLPNVGFLIGISMSYLDVHVNRAPVAGRIVLVKRFHGRFMSLKRSDAILHNERVLTVIDGGDLSVGVVQIASRMVRRIVPYVASGDRVERGQRIGMIRFGSQVDLVVPGSHSLRVEVLPREKVHAGVSVVATFSP